MLLTGYQTPGAIRRAGVTQLRSWLTRRKVRSAEQVAMAAVDAANAQHTVVPGQDVAATIVADVATQLLASRWRAGRSPVPAVPDLQLLALHASEA